MLTEVSPHMGRVPETRPEVLCPQQVRFAPGLLFQSPVVWSFLICMFCLGIVPEGGLRAESNGNGFTVVLGIKLGVMLCKGPENGRHQPVCTTPLPRRGFLCSPRSVHTHSSPISWRTESWLPALLPVFSQQEENGDPRDLVPLPGWL